MQEFDIRGVFQQEFGSPPAGLAVSPGRVNLIGEHTDYNHGFVLPMAINLEVQIAFRPRSDRLVRIRSLDLGEQTEIDLRNLAPARSGWPAYLAGVAWAMQAAGMRLSGWEGVMKSQVPVGSGLSSSAAVQLAAARVLAAVGGTLWEPARIAALVQRAENEWVGVRCGIMDPLASACGRKGHALLIDCRDLSLDPVPMPGRAAVVVLDSGTRRQLTLSGYNDRRAECEAAAQALGLPSLRLASLHDLDQLQDRLSPVLGQRARHVITENQRTLEAAANLQAGDLARFGQAMNASHASLRDDYQVSTPELDVLAALAQRHPACHGARMMGGGFGGSVVCLADKYGTEDLVQAVLAEYRCSTGREGRAHVCHAADGTRLVT